MQKKLLKNQHNRNLILVKYTHSQENDIARYEIKLSQKECIRALFIFLSFLKQPVGSIFDWLLAILSAFSPCSVPSGWMWCREGGCVVG